MMGEALGFYPDGWPTWRSVVIIAPRKNGKRAMLAALSLHRLLTDEGRPEILLAAPSDEVAGRLFDAAARFVCRSEELSGLLRVRDHAGEIVREDGMGIVYRLSSDPARLYGYNATHVVVDELAQWATPSAVTEHMSHVREGLH
jgi:phage terminase large subunit-like protein